MIISYGGKNCWVFKDWFEIDFRINKNVPKEYGFESKSVVPFMCFEGPNASGKTCALRVLSFLADFCSNSFSYAPDSDVPYDSFFYNRSESEMFITFTLPDSVEKEYYYEVKFDDMKIKKEKLCDFKGNRKNVIIERDGDIIKKTSLSELKGFRNSFRPNASIFSSLYQYGIKSIKPFISFFASIKSNIKYLGRYEDNTLLDPANYYHEHPDMLTKVIEEIKKLDTGIRDIKISDYSLPDNSKVYYSVVYNETEDGAKPLSHHSMSTGTKMLYTRLKDIFDAINDGGVLVLDELDCHLHSFLVPKILNYFTDSSINKKCAQLIFTSHDSSLLDITKKYRTYIFEKEKGEGICYRIDELPSSMTSRNDRSLEQTYKSGVIGGIPNV